VIVGLWAGAACEWPVGEPGRGPVQPTTASPHIKEGEGECPTLIPSPCLPSNRHCRWLVLQRRRWLVLLPMKAGRREHHQCRSMSLRCSSVVPTLFSFGSVSRRPPCAPACAAGRRPMDDRQWSKEGSPSAAGLQVPRRIPGRRSTAPTRPNGLGAAATASWVAGVEEADGGPPSSEKNGGAAREPPWSRP
jgi:hypothetical protein